MMPKSIGRRAWAVAEGYIPPASTGETRQLTSHETICILNAGDQDAKVEVTVYFSNRAPVGPYRFTVGAKRTSHLRFNEFTDPEPVPGTPISPASSNRTCRSSCSARGWTAARRRSRC